MAEVKSACEKTVNKREKAFKNKHVHGNPTFNTFDICCVLFSLGAFVADLSTDIILVVEYSRCGYIGWAVSTLLLMLLPASVIQLFSLRWHKLDEQMTTLHYVLHSCLLGVVQRHYIILRTGLVARASGNKVDFQKLYNQQSDLCMLHLFESFMESAPQLVLQLYIILKMGEWHSWTGLSASASLCSLAWAIAAYTRAMRRSRPDKNRVRWPGLILQATWRGGMLAARISAMVLFALAFQYWLFLIMGLHWVGMTTWIILQDTDFCPSAWEERIYNGIVGVIYCFSFFNICEGKARKRMFTFYLVVVTQNVACLILVISMNLISSFEIKIVAAILIIGGTLMGLTSMSFYYLKFHPAGPVPCCPFFGEIEENTPQNSNDVNEIESKVNTLRSLKHIWTLDRGCNLATAENGSVKSSPQSDDGCTDKKLLLENWIARSGSPTFASVPISQELNNSVDDIEFHTVTNTPDTSYDRGVINTSFTCTEKNSPDAEKIHEEKHKRRGICSPIELGLKLDQFAEDDSKISPGKCILTSKKRRGICSSDQLVLELNELNNLENVREPVIELNLNDDVKLKRRPIYSVGSTLNSFSSDLSLKNMFSVKLVKMSSDDKSVCSSSTKPEEYMEVSSEVLSAHDYENICAVNIARERWGLRSWEGYTDIETFLHDDSTVRDRRRDTLTSTVTGTSASSEISSSDTAGSPSISSRKIRPLRTRQDDYLDTLIYDLVDCDKRRVQILDCSDEHEVDSNIFIAKPYVVDQHGMMFPLGTPLEPIEELEEPSPDKNDKHKTQSALVATIDEIRRGNDTDSPRHVYHRTENLWDDEEQDLDKLHELVSLKKTVNKNIPKSLWNEPVKNCNNVSSVQKIDKNLRDNFELPSIHKTNNINEPIIKQCEDVIDIIKNVEQNKLIFDQTNDSKLSEQCKLNKTGSKPRRKFSLLREKFEPKTKENDDILMNCSLELGSTVNLIDDLKTTKVTTPVITKVMQWNNLVGNQAKHCSSDQNLRSIDENSGSNARADRSPVSSMRDKRNIFLKQVLSPPKFHNKSKKYLVNPKEINSK